MQLLDFAEYEWTSSFSWQSVMDAEDLPAPEEYGSSALCLVSDTQIAIFRSAQNKLFASQNLCGHRVAFVLSEGTVRVDEETQNTYVMCPMHHRKFFLDGDQKGRAKSGSHSSNSIATFAVKEQDGHIWLYLPSVEELDAVLGTQRWNPPKSKAGRLASMYPSGPAAAARRHPHGMAILSKPPSAAAADKPTAECASADSCGLKGDCEPPQADDSLREDDSVSAKCPVNVSSTLSW